MVKKYLFYFFILILGVFSSCKTKKEMLSPYGQKEDLTISPNNCEHTIPRKIVYRDLKSIKKYFSSEKNGKATFYVCINPKGEPIYVELTDKETTIKEMSVLKDLLESVRNYRWESDEDAPNEQCGNLSFTFDDPRNKN